MTFVFNVFVAITWIYVTLSKHTINNIHFDKAKYFYSIKSNSLQYFIKFPDRQCVTLSPTGGEGLLRYFLIIVKFRFRVLHELYSSSFGLGYDFTCYFKRNN